MKKFCFIFLVFSSIVFTKNENDIPQAQLDLSSLFQNTSKNLTQLSASQSIPSVLDNYSYLLQTVSVAERKCQEQYQMSMQQKYRLLSHGYADIVEKLLAQKHLTDQQIWSLWEEYKNKRWWDWNNEKIYTENDLRDALEKRKRNKQKQILANEKAKVDEKQKVEYQKSLQEYDSGMLQSSNYVSLDQSSSDQAQLQLLPDERQFFENAYDLLENNFQDERSIERNVVRRQAIEQTKNDGFMQYAVAYNLTPQAQVYLNLYDFDPSDYGYCVGTALQQQFHREVISIFEKAARLARELPYRSSLLHSSLLLADGAHEANKFEQIQMVAVLNDLSFQFLDTIETYSLAALRGVAKGAIIGVQALLHPLESIESLARAAHYVFETVALNDCAQEFGFEDLYVELCDQRNTEIAAAFSALGQKISQESGPEIIEELCSFGASFYVPGKVFQALGSVLGVLQATTETLPVVESALALVGDSQQVDNVLSKAIQAAYKLEQAITQQVTKQVAQKMFRITKKPKHPKKLARAALEGSTGKPTEPRTLIEKAQSALNKAKNNTENKKRELLDGRVRYYTPEKLSDIPGPTRGSSYVTEYDEKTNRIRQWTECYDHFGNVNRVRPKMINGREVFSQHYPATYKDILNSIKGSKWRTLENNVV